MSPTYTLTPVMKLIVLKGLYPNPMTEEGHIYFLLRNPAEVSLTAYNVAGEIILRRSVDLPAGANIQTWDGKNDAGGRCASGVYLMKVRAQNANGEHDEFWATQAITR